jgi:hypothetical protein
MTGDELIKKTDGLDIGKYKTLADAIPEEIKRCQSLIETYNSIGPAGNFAKIMIQADIDSAIKAMLEGDLVGMIRAYKAMKGCE